MVTRDWVPRGRGSSLRSEWGPDAPDTTYRRLILAGSPLPLNATYEVPGITEHSHFADGLRAAHENYLNKFLRESRESPGAHFADNAREIARRLPYNRRLDRFLDGILGYDRVTLSGLVDHNNPEFLERMRAQDFTVPDKTGYYFGIMDSGIPAKHIEVLKEHFDGANYRGDGCGTGRKDVNLIKLLKGAGCSIEKIILNDISMESMVHIAHTIEDELYLGPYAPFDGSDEDIYGMNDTLFLIPGDAYQSPTWDGANTYTINQAMRDAGVAYTVPHFEGNLAYKPIDSRLRNKKPDVVVTQGAWFWNNSTFDEIRRRLKFRHDNCEPGTIFIDAVDCTIAKAPLKPAYSENYVYLQFILNAGLYHRRSHISNVNPRDWEPVAPIQPYVIDEDKKHIVTIIRPGIARVERRKDKFGDDVFDNTNSQFFGNITKIDSRHVAEMNTAADMETIAILETFNHGFSGAYYVWVISRSKDSPKGLGWTPAMQPAPT